MEPLTFEANIGCSPASVEELQGNFSRDLRGAIELHNS